MSQKEIAVRNPATGEIDFEFEPTTAEALEQSSKRLRAGQRTWHRMAIAERVDVLREFLSEVDKRYDALFSALAADTGRLRLSETELAGIRHKVERDGAAAGRLVDQWAADEACLGAYRSMRLIEPYALVGNISPWNFPVTLSFLDSIPALLMGCAVIVKPSEVTPRFAGPMRDAVQATPVLRDVFDFVLGGADTGRALIDRVDFLCFTGSVDTGKRVYRAAAERFIPVGLEMGGKDAAIVLPDVDIERTAESLIVGAAVASGQICTSLERFYVAEEIHDELVEALREVATRARMTCDDDDGLLTPFIHAPQADIYSGQIADAVSRGATLHAGGKVVDRGGLWPEIAVLSRVDHEAQVMREESFAPILPVMPFTDDDQAVELANNSCYGLSAAVYGRDLERAARIGSRLRCGAVSLNRSRAHIVMRQYEQEPHGLSGLGRSRVGVDGLNRFVRRSAQVEAGFEEMAEEEAPMTARILPKPSVADAPA